MMEKTKWKLNVDNPYKFSLTTRFKDQHIIELIDINKDDKILDIGCGLGYFMEKIALFGINACGLDVSFESLLFCKQQIPGYYCQGDAISLPYKSNSFTKVLCTDVIEHLTDDESAISEINRVSKNGAVVIITVPALEGLLTGSKFNRLFHDIPQHPEYHVRDGYSADSLSQLMGKYGIYVAEIRYTTFLLTELTLEMLKGFYYLMNKDFNSQVDALKNKDTLPFKAYSRIVFPLALTIGRLEEKFWGEFLKSRSLKGHLLIVKGIVKK